MIIKNYDRLKEYYKIVKKWEYEEKESKSISFSRRVNILPFAENNNISKRLFDIKKTSKKITKRFIQNEITSISKMSKDKILTFTTLTITPEFNVEKNIEFEEEKTETEYKIEVDELLKKQYQEFQNFYNQLSKYHYQKDGKMIDLNYKSVSVYELTKNLNLHSHKINLLNDYNRLYHYIKSIIQKRQKNGIGRVEIRVDEEDILYLLENEIKTQKQNYKLSKSRKDKNIFIYKDSSKSRGNFIFIRAIKNLKNEENKKHITKYLFKYMLKANEKESIENIIFSSLKFKQKQFSHNFFTKKTNKKNLFKISSILHSLITYNKSKILDSMNLDKNATIYEVSRLLEADILKNDIYNIETQEEEIYILNGKKYELLTNINKYFKYTHHSKFDAWKRLILKYQSLNDFKDEQHYRMSYDEEREFENNLKCEIYKFIYIEDNFEKERLKNIYRQEDEVINLLGYKFETNYEYILKNEYEIKLISGKELKDEKMKKKEEFKRSQNQEIEKRRNKEMIRGLREKYNISLEDLDEMTIEELVQIDLNSVMKEYEVMEDF